MENELQLLIVTLDEEATKLLKAYYWRQDTTKLNGHKSAEQLASEIIKGVLKPTMDQPENKYPGMDDSA